MAPNETPGGEIVSAADFAAARVRSVRRRRRMSMRQLAERCAELGASVSIDVLKKVESGRQPLGLDMMLTIALALDVPPVYLLSATSRSAPSIRITGKVRVDNDLLGRWICGLQPLPVTDAEKYREAVGARVRAHAQSAWSVDAAGRAGFPGVGDRRSANELRADAGTLLSDLKRVVSTGSSTEHTLAVLDSLMAKLGVDTLAD